MSVQEKELVSATEVEEKGINTENVEDILAELQDALGEEWATSDDAVLTGYGRDFTQAVGKKPNIVALPGSTEDVQLVMKLANKYGMPVVPFSTGFNHAGLTLPRTGGILLDLKRMDKILNIDEESMTLTIQPHVRNAVVYTAVNKHFATDDLRLRPALSGSLGSASTLANHIARGMAAIGHKVGNTPEFIVNMTWVLPDGEIVKLGPSAIPEVENMPVQWGAGPDLSGMFINADGMFGVCTEMTIKLLAEWPLEKQYLYGAEDEDRSLEAAIEFIRDICQQDLIDFIYKSSYCQMAILVATELGTDNAPDLADSLPGNPVILNLVGWDEEEISIREKIAEEIAEKADMFLIDIESLIPAEDFQADPQNAKKIGPTIGSVMRYKGAFQFMACYAKLDKIPEIVKDFYKLRDKYWKESDPEVTGKMSLAGSSIQGPLPFARASTLEYDFWWDPGNPEDVTRAALMIRKSNELNVRHGAILWRNMFGHGEIHFPRLGKYYELLKMTKKALDPDNIMHPDIHPVTDDYV
jgi:FAD/FMN-containing dehydrogenase